MDQTRKNRLTDLGELQLQVLDALAASGTATVQAIVDRFPADRRPRYTTVLTVLRALEAKGLASHTTEGRTYYYSPTPAAGTVRSKLLCEMLDKVFNGSPRALVATLLDTDAVTPAEIEELRRLIAASEE